MVYLWVSIAIVSSIAIGCSTNYILSKAIKNKEKNDNYKKLINCHAEASCDNEIDEILDQKFNNQNKNLSDFKINITNTPNNQHSEFKPNIQDVKSKVPTKDDFEINI